MRIRCLFIVLLFACVGATHAQTNVQFAPLPAGYGDIQLGMTFYEVTDALARNSAFGYRGEPDVSLLPSPNRVLIETAGPRTSVFERCWFQFYDERLYIITLSLNRTHTDHYSVFSTLCFKYGDPATLTSEKTVWQNDAVIMSLERPLTLRYVDAQVFQQLLDASSVDQSAAENMREQFLEGL
jgi:hypothetical protein